MGLIITVRACGQILSLMGLVRQALHCHGILPRQPPPASRKAKNSQTTSALDLYHTVAESCLAWVGHHAQTEHSSP